MKTRESNIELLRIICILGVIILHYNSPFVFGNLEIHNVNFYILSVTECIFICAVNCFLIITGFFLSCNNKRSLWRPIELIIQLIFFRISIFFLSCFIGHSQFNISSLIINILPVNYFVILYSILYIFSPYINNILSSLSQKEFKRFLYVTVIIFSVYATFTDIISSLLNVTLQGLSPIGLFGNQDGYTIVHFIMMYIIGAYIKRYNLTLKLNKSIILYLFNLILIILLYLKGPRSISLAYNNPFIVNISVVVFILFKKIEISNNIVINKLSKGVFTVFLVHNFFLEFINRYYYVNKPTHIMLVHMMGSCIMIFIVCYICYVVYENTVNRTLKVISKKFELPNIWCNNDKGI